MKSKIISRPPFLLFSLGCAGVVLAAVGCHKSRSTDENIPVGTQAAKQQYLRGLDSLSALLVETDSALGTPGDSVRIRSLFRAARALYKRGEFATEYHNTGIAAKMNGPDLPEWDEDEAGSPPEQPEGLQVLEGLFYPRYRLEEAGAMRAQVRRLQARTLYLKRYVESRDWTDATFFDALLLGTARIGTKGLTGFDSPVALFSLTESGEALQGIREGFRVAYGKRLEQADAFQARNLDSAFRATIRLLRRAHDFNGFDRAAFLADHLNPLCIRLRAAQQTLGIPLPTDLRALKPGYATVFDSGAFDPWYFAPEKPADSLIEARRALGQILFFDPVLSGNGQRSCASCHHPEAAFTDGLPRARGFDGRGAPLRNAPTLINAGLQRAYFSDLAVIYLEDQASQVLRSEREMHALPPAIAHRLLESPEYARLFHQAFPAPEDSTEKPDLRLRQALAAYVRSLVALNSPFDRSMRGQEFGMSPEAKRGFNLFTGKAKCATCHFAPLFNGTVPPEFSETEKEVIGVTEDTDFQNPRLDADPGRFAIVAVPGNRHAFKTPTLRNVALTAPYMHNGAFKTLEQVVEFYNAGGGAGLGLDVPNQTLPTDSLHLTPRESADLVAFLRALTDTAGTTGKPATLPEFPRHAEWNKRKMGGRY